MSIIRGEKGAVGGRGKALSAPPLLPSSIRRALAPLGRTFCTPNSLLLHADSPQGKSLSLICGSLTWLRDHKRRAFLKTIEDLSCQKLLRTRRFIITNSGLGGDEPEWMLEFAKREKSRALTEKIKELEARLEKARAEEEKKQKEDFFERPRKKQVRHGLFD